MTSTVEEGEAKVVILFTHAQKFQKKQPIFQMKAAGEGRVLCWACSTVRKEEGPVSILQIIMPRKALRNQEMAFQMFQKYTKFYSLENEGSYAVSSTRGVR